MQESFILANGLSHHVLRFEPAGEARGEIVLCHGFLDQALTFTMFAEALCEAGYVVHSFDWRGHGQTEHIGKGGYYHFADYVLDLHELMPQLTDAKVHLIGHSMGGTIVSMYASTHPEQLRSLTVIEGLGPPSYEGEAPDALKRWLDSVDQLRRSTPKGIAGIDDALRRMRLRNPQLPDELGRKLAEIATVEDENGELRWRFDALHRTRSPVAFRAEVFKEYLRHIQTPTLVIQGEKGFRTDDVHERIAEIADAREVEISDAGHMMHWTHVEELAAAVLGHISKARS